MEIIPCMPCVVEGFVHHVLTRRIIYLFLLLRENDCKSLVEIFDESDSGDGIKDQVQNDSIQLASTSTDNTHKTLTVYLQKNLLLHASVSPNI